MLVAWWGLAMMNTYGRMNGAWRCGMELEEELNGRLGRLCKSWFGRWKSNEEELPRTPPWVFSFFTLQEMERACRKVDCTSIPFPPLLQDVSRPTIDGKSEFVPKVIS
jgi:hypothetical protein